MYRKIQCPCCGYYTIEDDGEEVIVDICPVCFWQYDIVGQEYPDIAIGPNHGVSLHQAQENYKKIGACSERFLPHVRPPKDDELKIFSVTVKEIDRAEFVPDKFAFIVGECESYNEYFQIDLAYKDLTITFGLQTFNAGIKPQAEVFDNKILIGGGDKFYVYDFQGELIKEYNTTACFCEFVICGGGVLVVSELDVFFLNGEFEKVWERKFNEIIDINYIIGGKLSLRDSNGKIICLDLLSGKDLGV